MEKAYVVYLNKSYDLYASDAYEWLKNKNIEVEEILSEPAFWVYMEKGLLENRPVYFCKEKLVSPPTIKRSRLF